MAFYHHIIILALMADLILINFRIYRMDYKIRPVNLIFIVVGGLAIAADLCFLISTPPAPTSFTPISVAYCFSTMSVIIAISPWRHEVRECDILGTHVMMPLNITIPLIGTMMLLLVWIVCIWLAGVA